MICELHNKINKSWFVILGETCSWFPDEEMSLVGVIVDIIYILFLPVFLVVGLVLRVIIHGLPDKFNIFKNIKFSCNRNVNKK